MYIYLLIDSTNYKLLYIMDSSQSSHMSLKCEDQSQHRKAHCIGGLNVK